MSNLDPVFPLEGGCTCRHVRYRMETAPLFVHCCHCRWCQRESGASFALNAMIEADRVSAVMGTVELVDTPTESGFGQKVARCPHCHVAVWSHYAGAGPLVAFVRVGTLDAPDHLPPDVHIFTASKQPWVLLPPLARLRCPGITTAKPCGQPPAWPGDRPCCHALKRTARRWGLIPPEMVVPRRL